MPRPTRLEYEGAFYHVMNRGRGRQRIFDDDRYFQAFLQTLKEARQRFGLVIHAYCLMDNHYHLLLETPHANLSRSMRHINGVYTQRYNRLKNTDGPLFRGRFKSIVVDADTYLLPLSRYIHRNPIETKRPLVDDLSAYPWSSYPAYTQPAKKSDWLETQRVHGILGKNKKYSGYKAYVEQGVDEDILQFYNKGNLASVLGDKGFKESLAQQADENEQNHIFEPMAYDDLISIVGKVYKTPPEILLKPQYGKQQANVARKVAMYCCQYYGDYRLNEIANIFGLTHVGSVSRALHDVKMLIGSEQLLVEMKQIEKNVVIKRT